MGQPHQLLSLDEGPSKGAATQIKTQILLLPGWLWQKGSKREVTRRRARAPIHSISSLSSFCHKSSLKDLGEVDIFFT